MRERGREIKLDRKLVPAYSMFDPFNSSYKSFEFRFEWLSEGAVFFQVLSVPLILTPAIYINVYDWLSNLLLISIFAFPKMAPVTAEST